MRRLIVVLTLMLATPARAEDTAAVLAALNDSEAEARYLMELCTRVAIATRAQLEALAATIDCVASDCVDADALRTQNAAAGTARDSTMSDFLRGAAVYRAKHGRDWLTCEPATESGTARIASASARLVEATTAQQMRADEKKLSQKCELIVVLHDKQAALADLLTMGCNEPPSKWPIEGIQRTLADLRDATSEVANVGVEYRHARDVFRREYGRDPQACGEADTTPERVSVAHQKAMQAFDRRLARYRKTGR